MPTTTTTGYKTTDIGNLFVSYSDFVASQPVATLVVENPITTTTSGTSSTSSVVTTSSSTATGSSGSSTSVNFYYGNTKFVGSYTNTSNVVLIVKENTAVSLTISTTPASTASSSPSSSYDLVYTKGTYTLASAPVIISPMTISDYASSIIITINDIYETTTTTTSNVVGQDWALSSYWTNYSAYMTNGTNGSYYTTGVKTTFPAGFSLALANNTQAYSNYWGYAVQNSTDLSYTFPDAAVNFSTNQSVFPNIIITRNNFQFGNFSGGGSDLDKTGNIQYASANYYTRYDNSYNYDYSVFELYSLPSINQYNNNLSSSSNVVASTIFSIWLTNGTINNNFQSLITSLYPLSVTTNKGAFFAVATSGVYNGSTFPCLIYIYALKTPIILDGIPSTLSFGSLDNEVYYTNYTLLSVGSLSQPGSTFTKIVNTGISSNGYHGIVFFPTKVYYISYEAAGTTTFTPTFNISTFTQSTDPPTTNTPSNIISGSLSQSSRNAICIDTGASYVYWSTDYGVTFTNIPTPSATINSSPITLDITKCQSCAVSPDGLQVIITTIMISSIAYSWTGTYNATAGTFAWVATTLSTGDINYSISNVTFDKNSISTNTGAVGYSPELSGFVTTSNAVIIVPASSTTSSS